MGFFTRFPSSAAQPPLRDLWAVLKVMFPEPIASDEGETPVIGFWQVFGVRAVSPERASALLEHAVTVGEIEWTVSTMEPIDPRSLDRDIRANIQPVDGEGIWFASARILFPADDIAQPIAGH